MSRRLSSKEFLELYEVYFSQQNAPEVKFQNPDAWRNYNPPTTSCPF